MKITIFGATGESGREFIEQALAEGYGVTIFARTPSKLAIHHGRLTVLQGELNNLENIERGVNGADAVISLLGPRPGEDSKRKRFTQATQNIITAMKKLGVRRLIVISTPSAIAPNDLFDLKFKALIAMIKTTMRLAYEEIVNVAQSVNLLILTGRSYVCPF